MSARLPTPWSSPAKTPTMRTPALAAIDFQPRNPRRARINKSVLSLNRWRGGVLAALPGEARGSVTGAKAPPLQFTVPLRVQNWVSRLSMLSVIQLSFLGCRLAATAAQSSPAAGSAAPAVVYTNDVDPKVPMSAHIIKVPRAAADLRFVTTYGKGRVLGMDNVSEQLKTLPPELGPPLAAINGDFYHKIKGYEGRPRDVQIRQGEVVS